MTEQENKIPTATEIEQQLRERRQKELEQAGKTPEEEPGKPALQLGIEKLKKSRKGMIILVVGFLLLAAGVSVYYIPSIIRSVSSGDEKPASQPLATGAAKRQTGLSEDIDPFNTAQKKQRNQRKKKSFLLKRLNRRKINSRASAVHLMFLLMAARQETAAVQRERQFHILRPVSQKAIKRMKQKQPHRLQNLRHWRK